MRTGASTVSPRLNDQQLQAARDWLADNTFADVEPDEFKWMPEEKIIRGISKFYAGGLAAFIRDGGEQPIAA